MEKRSVDLWVGIFVIVGFLAFLMLALKVGNFSFAGGVSTYQVKAHFDNIGGLKERAPVRSSGVTVGRVKSITLDTADFDALVLLDIESRYKFPKDTSAAILTSGLLGENYVGLIAGGASESLASVGEIKMTQDALVLENLIGKFFFNKAQEESKNKTE